jgi:hypothetical protein
MVRRFAQIDNRSIKTTHLADPHGSVDEETLMDSEARTSRSHRRSLRGGSVALLLLFVVSAPAFAACSAAHDASSGAAASAMPAMHGATSAPTEAAAAMPAVAGMPAGTDQPLANADALWAARPDFVRANPETVKWMPCYCGCGEMRHDSNLDCYLRPGQATYEEHASFCDICVQITLKTRDLVNQGKTLKEIRAVVDRTWGGSIPGTPTALPPV